MFVLSAHMHDKLMLSVPLFQQKQKLTLLHKMTDGVYVDIIVVV